MVQDHNGFLWIGTKDGLNRYDGYNFKIFRSKPSDSTSLSSNYVTKIVEDDNHNLWVETRPGGLHFYNHIDDTFLLINSKAKGPESFNLSNLVDLKGNENTGWWIATNKGLFHLNSDKSEMKSVTINGQDSLNINAILSSKTSDDFYLSVSDLGIFYFNPSDYTFTSVTKINQHLRKLPVDHLIIDNDGNWVAVQHHTIFTISPSGELISKHDTSPLTDRYINFSFFTQDKSGNYWGIRNKTLYEYLPALGQVTNNFPLELVNTLLIDRTGVFWIGTSGNGIYKYDPKTTRFGFSPQTFTSFLAPGFFEELDKKLNFNAPEIYGDVFTITSTTENERWILTRRLGLFNYNLQSRQVKRHNIIIPPRNDSTNSAFWMEQVSDGSFDILFTEGLVNYKPGQGVKKIISLKDIYPKFSFIRNLPVFEPLTVIKKHAGYYWFGSTEYGLAAYHIATDSSRQFTYNEQDTNSLSSNHILSIAPDPRRPESFIWAGTDGGGLNRINIETGEVLRFTEQDGLPNNVIYAIYPDSSGLLWMSSNKGIIRFNPETFEILNFTKSDGLQSDEFNRREHYQFEDGRILFCGTFGCNLFNPNKVKMNPSIPVVVFTSVSVMNTSALPFSSSWFTSTNNMLTLQVDWNQNIIGFEFAALEYSAPSKNRYKYRFPPFINEWTEIGTRREISFTNLDPGFYTLEVMGSNNDGTWSVEPARMGVQVFPPFWMTNTFRGIVLFMFSGMIAWLVWYLSQRKYRQQLRKLKYKMAVDQERLRISRDMHDDLGARLTQIRMMSEFASTEQSISKKVKSHFEDISKETKDVIQQFSEIVWSLNPNNNTLANLADFMVQYSENFCRKVNIPCRIQADEDFPGIPITSNVRHNLLSVLKEALNNAAKYAQSTEIKLTITLANGLFVVEIRDTGIGFNPSKIKSNGQGLTSMETRMESIAGKWDLKTSPKSGTHIRMSWPVPYHPNG